MGTDPHADKIKYRNAAKDEWPLCPHCKRPLKEIVRKDQGWPVITTAFWCPHCACLLSVTTQV